MWHAISRAGAMLCKYNHIIGLVKVVRKTMGQ